MSKVAVITGASGGIGRATAQAFAESGYRVALLARGLEGLNGARREIEAQGGEAMVLPTDVANAAQVEHAAQLVEDGWGPIDVWVNAAMATIYCPVHAISPEDFRRATEVTYLGTVHGTLAALKRMRARNRGTIVQVGSALAYRGIPLQAPYCGAKFAVRGFTDSLHAELRHDGVNVHLTSVQLGAFNTPQFDWGRTCMGEQPQPLPPIFQPELAARSILWAAHHRRREVWATGPTLKTIVGTKLLPGRLLDAYLASQAYEGQSTGEPLPDRRPDNLYAPVAADYGTHGRFDARAKRHSAQLTLNLHRLPVTVIALAAMMVSLAVAARRRSW